MSHSSILSAQTTLHQKHFFSYIVRLTCFYRKVTLISLKLLNKQDASQRGKQNLKKTPKSLKPLIDDGIIDKVIRPIMSGKEAKVYLVECGGELRCAKVYKDIHQRSFQNSSIYRATGPIDRIAWPVRVSS